MAQYQKNFLPSQAQPWVRQVQDKLTGLESAFRTSEVNNRSRDDQLLASYNRLDQAFIAVAAASSQALAAANAAQSAADAAAAAADTANGIIDNIYTKDGAGQPTTSINGVRVANGTISVDKIIAGTITGWNIRTASINRVELSSDSNSLRFADDSGDIVAHVFSGTSQGGSPGIFMSYGSEPDQSASNFLNLTDNGFILRGGSANAGQISGTAGGVTITTSGANRAIVLDGATQIFGGLSLGNLTASGSSTFTSTLFNTGAPTTSNAANVYLTTAGRFERSTAGSTREIKQNIQELQFDIKDFISINPVIFDYKDGIVSDDSGSGIIGFIAEDFESAGFDKLISGPEVTGDYKSLRYDKMYMFLHKVVQEINQRLEKLEGENE